MPSSITNNSTHRKISPLVVSLGEPAGIGPEIILKSWAQRHDHDLPAFFVVGSAAVFKETARHLNMNIPQQVITNPAGSVKIFPDSLPIFDLPAACSSFTFGTPAPATAPLVLDAIKQACDFIFQGQASGLVTAPIQKSVLYDAGFSCPGHTEYLSQLCQSQTGQDLPAVMMLAGQDLRVVPLTIHMALSDVPQALTPDLLSNTLRIMDKALRHDFGLENPSIAVAGLNPHAGEDGAMGQEEQLLITPVLDRLRADGLCLTGPLPADTMFHKQARAQYDAALCMYHDQALIPVKTLDFDSGVNITLGLPMVRTSPDHGTALNIAGQNKASPDSMINALKRAAEIAHHRSRKVDKDV